VIDQAFPLELKVPNAQTRAADYAKAFLKDWLRLCHSWRFDMVRLKEPMLLLIANDVPLASE
jgi:mRNA interferase YafQ